MKIIEEVCNDYNSKIRGGRTPEVDLIKGIAIVLVVFGHTFPSCREYIYLFHISVFMMASGYCWKNNTVTDLKSYRKFIMKKLRYIYLPYVLCNGIFVLLRNFFITINLYTHNSNFLILTKDAPYPQSIVSNASVLEIIKEEFKVLLGIGTTQLGSATWFLIALLIVLIIHGTLSLMFKNKNMLMIYSVLFIGLAMITLVVNNSPLRGEIRRIPCTYMAFLLGVFIKNFEMEKLTRWWFGVGSFFILIIMQNFGSVEMSAANIQNPIFFIIVSLAGWVLLWNISRWIISNCLIIKKVFEYVGKNTMPILCMHLLTFKLVSLLYVVINNRPKFLVASFHIIFETPEIYKIMYTIFGVSVPLMVYYIWKLTIQNIYNILNKRKLDSVS